MHSNISFTDLTQSTTRQTHFLLLRFKTSIGGIRVWHGLLVGRVSPSLEAPTACKQAVPHGFEMPSEDCLVRARITMRPGHGLLGFELEFGVLSTFESPQVCDAHCGE